MITENQNVEWKSIWKDEYLKWVCGFANAEGGTLLIGVDDTGKIIGIENHEKLLENLPNKMRDILGIVADVNLRSENGKFFLEINVEPFSTPISYHGHFYYRPGSTIQDLKGPKLEKLLLIKMGKTWDGIAAHGFSIDDLSSDAFDLFRKKARRSKRIPIEDIEDPDENLLKALDLFSDKDLKRGAILTFGKKPEKLVTGAYKKIGFFKTDIDLLYQDEIHGSLLTQVEKTMDILLTKYMRANIAYEGLTRTETYDFPEDALREAVLNAIIHKDYSSGIPIQISVYSDWLMIWNEGDLPKGWTVKTLKQKHTSKPANPDIATAFFRAGYIEVWGRGTLNIINDCITSGLPDPEFTDEWGGLAVIFRKRDKAKVVPHENSSERLGERLGESQIVIIGLINDDNRITIKEIANKLGINTTAVEKNIKILKGKNIIKRVGSASSGYWQIINA